MVRRGIVFLLENSLFLILGAVFALIWANYDHESYEHFVHAEVFGRTVHFWITDVGMSLFFLLAAKEVFESFLPGGSLSSLRKAATPLFATVGGMAVPAGLFAACCAVYGRQDVMRGWAIPCATDIAFSYMIAKIIFGANHVAIPFLLLIAIADDAGGLAILATFYSQSGGNMLLCLLLAVGAISSAIALRTFGTQSFWPYVAGPGVCSWMAFHAGGLHPALGLVPLVLFIPHERKDLGVFAEAEDALPDALNRLEHFFKPIVEVILGLFALVNAGVVFSNVSEPTFFVLFALLVGKPLGIFSCTVLATSVFGLEMPKGMTKRDLLVVGMVAGIGFTVSLFVSVVAFPQGGAVLDAAKMGALFSFGGGALAIATAKFLGVRKGSEPEAEDAGEIPALQMTEVDAI